MLTAYALSIGLNLCPQGHLDQSMIQDLGPSSELCNTILQLSLMCLKLTVGYLIVS